MLSQKRFLVLLFLAVGLLFTKNGAQAGPVPTYAVVEHLAIGGEGGWDYLLAYPASHRLFVSRSSHVAVVDTKTGKQIGDLPKTEGVHGIALAPDLGKGFTSNGRAGTVTVFDLTTLQASGEIKVTGQNPDAILFEPVSKRVFTFNGRTADATAIDAATGKVAGTIPLGGKPEFAASDPSGKVYVNIEDKAELVALDARTLAVEKRWPVAPCQSPTGLAIDIKTHRLFVGCGNKIMAVVSADDGKIVTTLPTGEGTDGVAFDPGPGLVFVSNGEGTLTIIHEESPSVFKVVQDLKTERGARTVAVDEATHRVYLPTARFGPAPLATAERPHPRPAAIPGSFEVVVVAPKE